MLRCTIFRSNGNFTANGCERIFYFVACDLASFHPSILIVLSQCNSADTPNVVWWYSVTKSSSSQSSLEWWYYHTSSSLMMAMMMMIVFSSVHFIFVHFSTFVLSILCPLLFTLSIRDGCLSSFSLVCSNVCVWVSECMCALLMLCYFIFRIHFVLGFTVLLPFFVYYFSGSKPVSVAFYIYCIFMCTESIPKIIVYAILCPLDLSLSHFLWWLSFCHRQTMQLTNFLINKLCIMFLFSLLFFWLILLGNDHDDWLWWWSRYYFILRCLALSLLLTLIRWFLVAEFFCFFILVHIQKGEIDI